MVLKKIYLSDSEIHRLDGLEGAEKAGVWGELKELRKQRKYGVRYRQSAKLLQFPPDGQIDLGIASGRMRFYDPVGKKDVELPLETERGTLLMPFRLDEGGKSIICSVRYSSRMNNILLQEEGVSGDGDLGFVYSTGNFMGHISFNKMYKGRGLALAAVKLARDHAMARDGVALVERRSLDSVPHFKGLFERAGYERIASSPVRALLEGLGLKDLADSLLRDKFYEMQYLGDARGENDLVENYRFIAVDPESGKRKSIYRERSTSQKRRVA